MALATKPIQREPSSNSVVHPYDLPKSIEFLFDTTSRHLTLRFNYIVSEPFKDLKVGVSGRLQVGKNSHRVFSLSVPTADLDILDHIAYSLLEVLRRGTKIIQENIPHGQIPVENYLILGKLVEEYTPLIIEFIRRTDKQVQPA